MVKSWLLHLNEPKFIHYETDDYGGFVRDWKSVEVYDRTTVSLSRGFGLRIDGQTIEPRTECRFTGNLWKRPSGWQANYR